MLLKFWAKRNPYFFIPFEIYIILGGFLIAMTEKGTVVLWLNGLHNPVMDQVMAGITFLGSGYITALTILGLLFYRFYHALLMTLTFLVTGGTVSLLKLTVFSGFDRPLKYFGENSGLHFVEGVAVHSYNSFPSGHSAEAFAIFTMASLILKNKKWGLVFFFAAFLVSISRPYLVQHFFVDTYAGASLGVIFSSLVFHLIETRTNLKNSLFWNRRIGK